MNMHEPNHRGGSEIEEALRGAKFRPEAGFEERLRVRLIERLPESKRKSWWQDLWDFIVRKDKEGKTVRGSRLMGAFGLSVVTLMVVLFVGLVLVRPSGMTSMGTEEPTVSGLTPQPVGMIFGGEIELVEASVEHKPMEGASIVHLYWKVLNPPTADYSIWVRGARGEPILAQVDEPLRGSDLLSSNSADFDLPTSEWKVGRLIHTSHSLDTPPLQVQIEVYNPQTGWTLTLEYQGHSLSTVTAFVWEATPAEVDVPEPTPTPPMPVAIPEIQTDGTPRAVSLSADGQWAAVESQIEGEWPQIHLHNLTSGEAIYVADGVQPQISHDGKWLVFVMRPREGDPRAWNKLGSIGLYDIERGEHTDITGIVQTSPDLTGATMPAISGDGRFIVFMSNKNLLPSELTGGVFDVYLFDRVSMEMKRVDAFSDHAASYISSYPSISADGNTIVFQTRLLEGAANPQIYVQDRETESERLIGEGYAPQISRDGSVVAYLRRASEGQGAGWINAFATNLISEETRWMGRVLDQEADGGGLPTDRMFALSQDGNRIAFWSVLEYPRGEDIGEPPAVEGLGSAYSTTFLIVYQWAGDQVLWTDHRHVPPGSAGWISSVTLSGGGDRAAFVWRSEDRSEEHIYLMAVE